MTKRKLTILHTESSIGWGGQEIRILHESIGMIKRGYRVIIAAPEGSNIFKRARGVSINTFPTYFQKKNPISILKVLSIINREKVDIVNTHSSSDSWVTSIAARLSRVRPKIIRTRHLSTPISRSFLSRILYDVLPDAVITTGEEIKQIMVNDNGFDGSKIFSIPTGIDLERFNPTEVKPAFQANGFSVGMIGVLRSWKGHRYLIEAVPQILKDIPDAVFYIVGDGPQRENIKNLIQEFSLEEKIFMLGYREDIPEVLASLDVIVHPSYANEGVPQSILQAMAMEKPVAASNAGAIKEVVIDGEIGFLIEPKNVTQLAEKVIELYKVPELRIKFGKEGRKYVEKDFPIGKMLDKIESLYKFLEDKSESGKKHEF
ncbi:MAG: glycosyltransferase family 4 protein [Thermodesulfovibrionia bacterium]|nr:glycosyltransferase family 4 protein [Thermodesulfovibrionia bacterium]